jgi:hypothetical protein
MECDECTDDDEKEVMEIAATLLVVKKSLEMKAKKRKNRTIWTKQWIGERLQKGAYTSLITELRASDADSYRNFLRMDAESFDLLLRKVGPVIKRQNTRLRISIPPEERLALTLRWLATGSLHFSATTSASRHLLGGGISPPQSIQFPPKNFPKCGQRILIQNVKIVSTKWQILQSKCT